MSILIKKVRLNDQELDIFIQDNLIKKIGISLEDEADEVIDGKNLAAIPSFINGHTHSAMTLMRGYGDDLPLMDWLNGKIWPFEAKLTEEDVYWGARLACLEMIKSGTTFFNDMYWHYHGTARAVFESGIRAMLAPRAPPKASNAPVTEAAASVVGWPCASSAQPCGIGSPRSAAARLATKAVALDDWSMTSGGPPATGAAKASGLVQ